mgnify:CR=1 FL=1
MTTEKIKCNEGSQLISAEMREFLKPIGITLDTSSAYNPAGNLLAENGIRRVKRAIGHKKFKDAWAHIQALIQSSPYSRGTQSPIEAKYGFQKGIAGIPLPEFIENGKLRKWTHKINRKMATRGNSKKKTRQPTTWSNHRTTRI